MARIRTIKPDFWTNDKVLGIKPLTRLLFIGMWNFADDFGRMDFSPVSIKARIFPNDEIAADGVRDMLNEMCSADLLMVYSANGKEYIEITGWDHQRIDKRQASKIPAPFAEGSAIRGIPPTPADLPRTTTTPAPGREGKGEDSSGREGKKETREVALSIDRNEFHIFWTEWPNRVGKPTAVKALASARKRGATFEAIMDGVRNYIRDKPPDRPWLNPATFLNQNRWEDQPATVTHGRIQETENLVAVSRRLASTGVAFGERPATPNVCDLPSGDHVRLLSQGGGERPRDLRGGDSGSPERISARSD